MIFSLISHVVKPLPLRLNSADSGLCRLLNLRFTGGRVNRCGKSVLKDVFVVVVFRVEDVCVNLVEGNWALDFLFLFFLFPTVAPASITSVAALLISLTGSSVFRLGPMLSVGAMFRMQFFNATTIKIYCQNGSRRSKSSDTRRRVKWCFMSSTSFLQDSSGLSIASSSFSCVVSFPSSSLTQSFGRGRFSPVFGSIEGELGKPFADQTMLTIDLLLIVPRLFGPFCRGSCSLICILILILLSRLIFVILATRILWARGFLLSVRIYTG